MKNKKWWILFTAVLSIGILATVFDVIKIEFWGRGPQAQLTCPVVLPDVKELGPYYTAPALNGRVFKELW